ncbi:TonB-dependent receptor [Cellvibrio polysaccharolyticus]|uniref:TonB-dependent receptor n=1 Tax=Cellvibrio polysaccharolyticus TaxID=2082724 RepID=A0A928V491_9GAMM|nr:TonB-dependent receptor [Cellvibrio polysaccharolyticus]MBE8716349.1 TonB-dependent receptor [Cellvibrio polysaccharolyticus]
MHNKKFNQNLLFLGVVAAIAAGSHSVMAQQAVEEEIIVSGSYRESLAQALDIKRNSTTQVDAIVAEDIGKFPDMNLAESMQRIAGVSIDREGGEGRQISIRGLGSDFTRVRVNGLEALSTAGQGSNGPNRSRGFDFNTFASELFSQVKVNKTQSAQLDEGSLGSTVDLRGSRPFDFDGFQISGSAQGGYNELSESYNPRFSGLVSNQTEDGRFGALLSVSYSEREILEEGFNPVRFDWGNGFGTSSNANAGRPVTATANPNNMYGFCSPRGYDPQTPRNPIDNELGSNANLNRNNGYGSFGIDENHCATGLPRPENTPENIAAYETATESWHPRYPGLRRQAHDLSRLGVTTSFQFRPTDSTLFNFDVLYSNYEKNQREDTLGVNLHRTANLGGKSEIIIRQAEKDSLNRLTYAVMDNVDFRTESAMFKEETEFAQYSLNVEHHFNDQLRLDAIIGTSEANYARPINSLITLDNTNLNGFIWDARQSFKTPTMIFPFDLNDSNSWEWRGYGVVPANANGSARGSNISEVRLNPMYVDNQFDTFKVDLAYDLNDAVQVSGGISFKDYTMTSREYRHISMGLLPQALPSGVSVGDISQQLTGYGKGIDGAVDSWLVPDFNSVAELLGIYNNADNGQPGGNYTLAGVGHYGSSGNNYTVNEETLGAYFQADFRSSFLDRDLRTNVGVRYAKTDITSKGYVPCAGIRAVPATDTTPAIPAIPAGDSQCDGSETFYGVGSATAMPGDRHYLPIQATNGYDDWLPSINLAWDATDDVILRFSAAKTMARPNLNHLSPTISGAPGSYNNEDALYSINAGNPKVDPYRADTYDFSAEWYFSEGALLSAAYFYKDIKSYIQRVRQVQTWDETGWPVGLLPEGFNGNESFSVQSYYNTPGGPLKGFELTYQQPFTFLPGFWQHFGFQANYTHVESKLQYVESSSVSSSTREVTTVYKENDLINMSPNSYNATLYFDNGKFSARISTSHRDQYLTNILVPELGYDLDGREVYTPDVQGKYATTNYDFNMSYRFTKQLTLSFEAINLTDAFDDRFAGSDVQTPLKYSHTGRQYYLGARYKY